MSIEECFFQMYKLDWECGIYDKNGMKGLVVEGFLSPENYQKIIGEAYTAPQGN